MRTYLAEHWSLMAAAKVELLASPARKTFEGDDQDFLGQAFSFLGRDIYESSPSLGKALLSWAVYKSSDVLESVNSIFDNMNGRGFVEVFKVSDFEDDCWDAWKEPKKIVA